MKQRAILHAYYFDVSRTFKLTCVHQKVVRYPMKTKIAYLHRDILLEAQFQQLAA